MVNNMKTRIRPWVKVTLIIILLISSITLYGIFISTKQLDIIKYEIINKNIPSNFNGTKIVHISDIHYKTAIKEKELKTIINKVNNLKPDIVILSGDILDNSIVYNNKDKNILIKYLSQIDTNLGKYIVRGDNDTDDIWLEIVESSGFTLLNNSYQLIYNDYENPIIIAGLDSYYTEEHLNNIYNYLNNDGKNIKYKILAMHEPDNIDSIDINNFNLVLAGHSLGGQVKIPIIQNLFLPKNARNYYKDYYKIKNTKFYISSGLGTTKIQFRLFNNPSINIYTLKNK